uniref:Uncharacterized protein n=1 Tax=Micrurus surinamensis TaxID=129470 RepID=A0A2D4PUI4_MICSU
MTPRVLNFKRADFNKLRENLGKIPWMKILMGKTTQESWETLKSMIIEAQTSTIPLRKKNKKSKKKPAWLHKDLWKIERKKRTSTKNGKKDIQLRQIARIYKDKSG